MQNRSLSCPACGAPYTPDHKFCAACGAKLSTATPPAEAARDGQTQYACPNCGQLAQYGIPFCTKCGAPFEWQPEQIPPAQPPIEQSTAQQPPQRQTVQQTPARKKVGWFVPFMAVMGVFIVAGVIVMVVYGDILGGFLRSLNSPEVVYNYSPTTTTAAPTATPASTSPATTPPATISQDKQILITYSGTAVNQIGGHIYPDTGNAFLVVDIKIDNQGYDQFTESPLNFEVTVNKTKYNADITSSSDIAGVLQPSAMKNGDSVSGKLAFEVLNTTFISDFKMSYTSATGYKLILVKN